MKTETRQELFDTILAEYSSMIAKICYMYGSTEDQRKDLYQECMANVWQGLRSFRGDSKLSTWLYRACVNTCITNYRHTKNQKLSVGIDEAADVETDEISKADQLKTLYELIAKLSAIDRAIIMMWLDEKSYDEISSVTGMPRNTVASRIHRIKERLSSLSES